MTAEAADLLELEHVIDSLYPGERTATESIVACAARLLRSGRHAADVVDELVLDLIAQYPAEPAPFVTE